MNSILFRIISSLFTLIVGLVVCSTDIVLAAGIVIPVNCSLNVGSCTLNVSGDVTNAGTISGSTGTISLTGNWINSGTFSAGTGTVVFNATSGTQTLNTGGLANAFYNLTHNAASTVQIITNVIDINNTFLNSSGTFDANSLNMTVGKDWNNTSTFTPGTNTVTFDGTSQTIYGTSTFYNLTKQVTTADTFTLQDTTSSAVGQTATHRLTMQGAVGQLLSLRSTINATYAKINLQAGGAQSLRYLNVKDSNASGGTQLVAGSTSTDTGPNANLNWSFGNVTATWDGSDSIDWDDPFNWDLGLVPAPGDTVSIPPLGGGVLFQPTLSTNVTIGNLTIQASAVVTLNGKNLTVSTTFTNSGNVILKGSETLNFTQDTTNPGTFTYVGTGAGTTITVKDFGVSDYYNLVINDANVSKDTFVTNGNLTTTGAVTVTLGTLNISTNSNTLTIAGALTINGGTLTATNGVIDANGAVVISSGTLTAPSATTNTAFTIAGDWTHSGGTFTHSSGKVTLDGTNQSMTGSSTFYRLRKVVVAAATLTLEAGATQTINDDITFNGASGQLLSLRSSSSPTQTNLTLVSGGTQDIRYVDVKDNNASGGLQLFGRSASVNSLNNLNWAFGGETITWDGSTSTDWDTASNWDKGLVPSSSDTAIIANAGNQPATLATNTSVDYLTINASAIVNLAGKNMSVLSTFTNNGNFRMYGSETLTVNTMDVDSGIITLNGNGDGVIDTHNLATNFVFTSPSDNTVYDLIINDTNGTPDIFSIGAGAFAVKGLLTVNGGTLTGLSGTLDVDGNVTITTGTLIAPSSTSNTAFTVGGNWTYTAGTFTHSSGKVILDGTSQTMSGSSSFYRLRKVVSTAATLTLMAGTTQTVSDDLTLSGAVGQLLSLRSSSTPTVAYLTLVSGGTQAINYVDVKDNNAGGGLELNGHATSTNSLNNTNWVFGTTTVTWDGSTSTDWDTQSNWDKGFVPTSIDSVAIANAGSQPATLATNVSIANLTINASATVNLAGKNLTVSSTLTNNGNLRMYGSETVTINTTDTDSGTITLNGNGDGTVDTFNLADKFVFTSPADNAFYSLTVNDTNGTPDAFSTTANTFTINGNLTVSGGAFTAVAGGLDVNGSVSITSGTLVAPSATTSTAFTVAGDFSHTGGTFTHSSGRITFDTTTTATITGDSTFYDFYSTVPGKQINFTATSNQIIDHLLNIVGSRDNKILLRSSTDGAKWNITFPNGVQTVSALNVKDSNALTNTVQCLNCIDAGNNNSNWLFVSLIITAPGDDRAVGQNPTIIGTASANTNVKIKGIDTGGSEALVATTRADANGNFRVVLGNDDDTDSATTITAGTKLKVSAVAFDNYLTPYILNALLVDVPGLQNDLTVVTAPTTSQVPTIASPTANQRVHGNKPTIIGVGKASETVTVVANDAAGALLLSTVGTATVDSSGNYSVTLTTALPKSVNYISIVVDTVASDILTFSLTDPFGIVFDSATNKPINNAIVTIYKSNGQIAQNSICDGSGNITTVKDIACADTNPYTTGTDGFYSFLTASATYYMVVSAVGYSYPSDQTSFFTRTIVTGSKGEQFTVGTDVIEMDHPVDGNGFLLRIEKDSNKSEVKVGDVITYTVTIQNLSSDNEVKNVLLQDKIPPGFKYLSNRVLLDGVPLQDPEGNRPLVFSIGTINAGATRVLRYQLVVGSGVVPGTYDNAAIARYSNDIVISNTAVKSVKVVIDPLFDLGSVIGKVFYDFNENGRQDPPEYSATEGTTIIERPVPNIQIVTEDGTVVTTDRDGKFSIPGLLPGRHILRLDERSLPEGTFLTTNKAVVIDVTQGMLVKANFGVNADNAQIVGKDAVFFNEKIALTQDHNKPVGRLNTALFSFAGQEAKEELVMYNGTLVREVEWRIFTNYSAFIDTWRLDIIDRDTKKLVKRFEGTRFNMHDPFFWDGRGNDEKVIRMDHQYAYILHVDDAKNQRNSTIEKNLNIRIIETEDDYKKELEKDLDKEYRTSRAEAYRKWVDIQSAVNNTDRQGIDIQGETVFINRQGQDIKSMRLLKNGQLFADVPVEQYSSLSPAELLAGGIFAHERPDQLEIIVPNGDYALEIIGDSNNNALVDLSKQKATTISSASGNLDDEKKPLSTPGLQRYTRKLKIGDDYMMFVGMGDAKVGYSFNRGNVEAVGPDDKFNGGFWKEGKAAYYLKGKIKGKYLVTSSFDTDRERKELLRRLDPNTYYPIYGDQSSINYDATNTQGPLYLLVEWDKSSAIWGNYAVDFGDTEFAAFSRSFYGGKLDYQSLANNSYGDARSKVVVFHAEVQQRPAHNEFLGTGGSLYFLKHKEIIQGSDKIKLEIRDKITGLVVGSREMKNGADYELDESQGRILFWQPVAMIAKAESIVSDSLIDGNPVYMVVDYQYAVKDKLGESSEGTRVAQGIGDQVVVGGTYVRETQTDKNYTLKGNDVTVHLGDNATVKAEYAQTQSTGAGVFISTDGGITFTELKNGNVESGTAYGLQGDARLFDRVGLTTYYKWIENSFSSTATASQQGKELKGMALTFDLTPVTRLTAKQDIQRLINNGNLQTTAQVGATETTTTLVQIVHETQRLSLTGAYEIKEVKEKKDGFVTATNEVGKILAGKAEYALNGRVSFSVGQQFDVIDPTKNVTTVGTNVRVTNNLTARAIQAFGSDGTATTFGVTSNVTGDLAITTDYTVDQKKTGEIDKTTSIGAQKKINDKISTSATVAVTDSSLGTQTTTGSLATKTQVNDKTNVEAVVGKVSSSTGQEKTTTSLAASTSPDDNSIVKTTVALNDESGVQTKSLALDATQKVDDKRDIKSNVKVDEDALGGKTTTVSFGDATKINDEVQAVSERAWSISETGTTSDNKYALVRQKDGKKLEANLTRQLGNNQEGVSQSNIFGLTGDVNDKLALQGSFEKGAVQNLNGTRTDRTGIALGAGYVYKDTETAVERLKNSTKIELRLDDGNENKRQFVFYNALEGKITDNASVFAKLDYSQTFNTSTDKVEERHKEIILGGAYRPVNFDRLNLIARYTYKENQGPEGQVNGAASDIERNRMQVLAAEAVYDIDENWQLAEKFAFRINDEKVRGFEFNRTHTWLMIHRVNYRIDPNWTLGGEYRKLTQREAKDSKQGFLFEATRNINENTQLGIGWNFTKFSDDMTNVQFTSQGPFLRMTGMLYDRTPEEKARARAKWLDERINQWAWIMVKKELAKPNSKVVDDLNNMFIVAQHSQATKKYDVAQQSYKDIIMAGQMMFDEASEYIRTQIAFEEKLQEYNKTADQYFKEGEYIKARKLWEKVVDDARNRVVQ